LTHCEWYGVTCNGQDKTTKLELQSNALSGTLSTEIASLDLLEILDLGDNDIKGAIPTKIGLLYNLEYLRLCYNQFTGQGIDFLDTMNQLSRIHLHGNRLSGDIPSFANWPIEDDSSFISDCGKPTVFADGLTCEGCTMCCNKDGNCYPSKDTDVQAWGFRSYSHFTWVFFGSIFGLACVTAILSWTYDEVKNYLEPNQLMLQSQTNERDGKYALEVIGEDSVYQFFLGKSVVGWVIAMATMVAQLWMNYLFVQASEVDLSDDRSDLAYTWMCPRDAHECNDTGDLSHRGWVALAILLVTHVMKDIINGLKLVVFSGKHRNGIQTRVRFFIGGTLLTTLSLFTFFTSIIYNSAIATSDTDIIMNSVAILFIRKFSNFVNC